MDYRQLPADAVLSAVEEFLRTQPETIPDSEFDLIFDGAREALLTVGTFNEGIRDGADFVSSRYVDQIPCIGVSVENRFPKDKIIRAAHLAQARAHRPYALVFDMYPDYIASLPNALIGTLPRSGSCGGSA